MLEFQRFLTLFAVVQVYHNVSDYGWAYLLFSPLFFIAVTDCMVYFIHRGLHWGERFRTCALLHVVRCVRRSSLRTDSQDAPPLQEHDAVLRLRFPPNRRIQPR